MKTTPLILAAVFVSPLLAPRAFSAELVKPELIASELAAAKDDALYNDGTRAINEGRWSDAVYISPTTAWAISNPFVGVVQFKGTLLPGQSYTQTLTANVPSLTPGAYHVIVRTDIFAQVFEDTFRSNDTTASPGVVTM